MCSSTRAVGCGTPRRTRCGRRCRQTRRSTSGFRRSSGTSAPDRCVRASSTRSSTGRKRWSGRTWSGRHADPMTTELKQCEVWHDDHPPHRRDPAHPRRGGRPARLAARDGAADRGGVQRGERGQTGGQGGAGAGAGGRCAMTPYYQDEYVTIYHGDCREILPALIGAGVEAIITDPPYNAINRGTAGLRKIDKGRADSEPVDIDSLAPVFARLARGSVYVWCAQE